MSSIAESQPRTGRRNFNLRAYLAGTAATAALIGAVVLAFASLGAYVAFNGLPIGGSDADAETSSVAVERAVAPPDTARQGGGQDLAPANVRRADGSQATAGNGAAANASQASPAAADTAQTPPSTPTEPTVSTGGGSVETVTPTPAQTGPSDDPPSAGIPTPHVTTPDSVGGTVGTVEQTLHDVGVDVPLTGSGSAVEDVSGLLGN